MALLKYFKKDSVLQNPSCELLLQLTCMKHFSTTKESIGSGKHAVYSDKVKIRNLLVTLSTVFVFLLGGSIGFKLGVISNLDNFNLFLQKCM